MKMRCSCTVGVRSHHQDSVFERRERKLLHAGHRFFRCDDCRNGKKSYRIAWNLMQSREQYSESAEILLKPGRIEDCSERHPALQRHWHLLGTLSESKKIELDCARPDFWKHQGGCGAKLTTANYKLYGANEKNKIDLQLSAGCFYNPSKSKYCAQFVAEGSPTWYVQNKLATTYA